MNEADLDAELESLAHPDWLYVVKVPVFNPGAVEIAMKEYADRDKCRHLLLALTQAQANQGQRTIQYYSPCRLRVIENTLNEEAPNFKEVTESLVAELALCTVAAPEEFKIAPILLVGPSGCGKTRYARRVAELLEVPMQQISAGGAQGPFDLAGTSIHWSSATPGHVFKLLAGNINCGGVLLVDEADKLPQREPMVPALLDLLEPTTAKTFMDQSLRLNMDASHLINILTANDVDTISLPLRSRVNVFQVKPMAAPVRTTVVARAMRRIMEEFDLAPEPMAILVSASELERLAEVGDMRVVNRAIRRALGRYLRTQRPQQFDMIDNAETERRVGFI